MRRMQAGSLDALGVIYDRYRERAFLVARAVSVDAIRAEEAVQEGFVSIWNSRASYRPQAATAAPWLLTVVRHRAIDITRRDATDEARRVGEALLRGRRSGDDVAGEAVARAEALDLRRQLAGLPEAQRQVVFLAFYGELTHVEIAERLALPVGTVKGRIRLGLHKLRHQIGQHAA
jgi:RNA polymerase sigma-70 factor (ECF subfamily)